MRAERIVSGYYDYSPTVNLERPLVLSGHPGSSLREVGQNPFAFSHAAGEAPCRTCLAERGLAILEARPTGIVVIGEGAVTDPRIHGMLIDALFVFLTSTPASSDWKLRWRVQDQGHAGIAPFLDFRDSIDDVRNLYRHHKAALGQATLCVDEDMHSVHHAVHEVTAVMQRPCAVLGANAI
ncbi:MAG: hypothetical protein VX733_13345 [Candidatus Latescibacterota bacterium]|nr:hypothetical protein [Candidatus Latescibacterota bacterium]